MILSPKSTGTPPELNPSESTPLENNPPKRQNSPSSHSDLKPSSPKKPKLNSPVQESSSSAKPMTHEELREQLRHRFIKSATDISDKVSRQPLPKTLPKGYAFGCYIPGGSQQDFVYKMHCLNCGKSRDHKTRDCKDKETEEAKEWRKKHLYQLSSDEMTKPENK